MILDEREKDIQKVCQAIKELNPEITGDFGSGAKCPFCCKMCNWDAGNLASIEHESDCIVLIAKDLSTNL